MAKLADLPSEVLVDICLYVSLISVSDAQAAYEIDPNTGDPDPASKNRIDVAREYCNGKALTNSFVPNIDALYSYEWTSLEEVYEATSRVRSPQENILSLSLTCKRLHEIVEPLLWAFVETDLANQGSIRNIIRILSTVMRKPELGRHTKALAFRHFISDDFDSPFNEKEKLEMQTILEWDTAHQFAALLDRLPNLKAMKLAIEDELSYFPVFKPSTLYPSGFPLSLQNLTEFSFLWNNPDDNYFGADMMLPFFLLPNLKTLYLGYISVAAEKKDLHDFTRYYGTSTITSLILDFAYVEEAAITAYCKLPKRLERFEYTYPGGWNHFSNAEPDDYSRALLLQNASLNKLKIRGSRNMQTSQREELPDPNILRSFSSLTEFAFPISLLLYQQGVRYYKLGEVLPPNVEKVTLLAYGDWTFDGVHDMLKDFFSFGAAKFPSLKEMRVEIWLQEHDYTLHAQKDMKSEAEGVISWRVESLKQRAKDKGVTLEVGLDTRHMMY
ncbi:hypothetical protein N431DRAFT_462217 [Stipitochalara longipes BDJ]|nr:hypothetical protein N431DRAFT_462217 [Stipitochalara longipes BDJ]